MRDCFDLVPAGTGPTRFCECAVGSITIGGLEAEGIGRGAGWKTDARTEVLEMEGSYRRSIRAAYAFRNVRPRVHVVRELRETLSKKRQNESSLPSPAASRLTSSV